MRYRVARRVIRKVASSFWLGVMRRPRPPRRSTFREALRVWRRRYFRHHTPAPPKARP